MTHTIIIETQNDTVFEQVKEFAKQLGVPFSEKHTDPKEAHQQEALKKFFGSWEGEETGDELVDMIYSARNDQPRDVEL
ncbi:hypothetical protein [Larkinella terrae]|uniref:Uncharacterized protein n=1 Tax=Larkinella terrae TaxID=2025311 RepID=A0A7K0EFN7_9BACT|nr:hypothetical protein [Larkinella terrae]MRS60660.1 hypothetical protein [Larkinella terrae]